MLFTPWVLLRIFVCACCCGSALCGEATDVFEKSVVWRARENEAEGFRIPGMVVTPKGTVLAFAEERPEYGDADPKSLVLKRSRDEGRSWSEDIYIERCDGSFWAEHRQEIDSADVREKREVWTNPCPVVDRITGRIFFFYSLSEGKLAGKNAQRYTRVFYRTSENDGTDWSARTEMTDLLHDKEDGSPHPEEKGKWIRDENGFSCDFLGRTFHMPGPGHGLQLTGGRLLIPFWNRTALQRPDGEEIPVAGRGYGLRILFSDDHGQTWKAGSAFGHNGWNMNESRMAELPDGRVYINARYVPTSSKENNNRRLTAISHDSGKTWTGIRIDRHFPLSNPCDAGLVAYTEHGKSYLLYSKNESTEGRKNLIVRWSYDNGETWSEAKGIDEGNASYSDLAVLPDNTILLLYETGKNSPVYCARFNRNWLGLGK